MLVRTRTRARVGESNLAANANYSFRSRWPLFSPDKIWSRANHSLSAQQAPCLQTDLGSIARRACNGAAASGEMQFLVRDCSPDCSAEASLGNTLGQRLSLRAFSLLAGADMLLLQRCTRRDLTHQMRGWLPDAAPAAAVRAAGIIQTPQPGAFAAACHRMRERPHLLHEGIWAQRHWWAPAAPQLAWELKAALNAYRMQHATHLELDDAVLHVRPAPPVRGRATSRAWRLGATHSFL